MLFNSFEYLLFLPLVFLAYWLLRERERQNLFLVAASYFFYACWDWRFLSLILVTTISSYASGCLMDRPGTGKGIRRTALAANLILNLAILGFYKYFNFFAQSFSGLLASFGVHADYPTLNIILPVGISFYTFQAIGYSVDVYVRRMPACRSLVSFAAFICFFPQLVAGPIEPASHLLPQFQQPRRFSYDSAATGLRMILWGLFKKMAVADNCAATVDMVWNDYSHFPPLMLALASLLFTIQIYCDFSGYSDIAIGSARLFGIELIGNFKLPYFSTSIPEFWRRWHISLMNWFRTYIYFPLGGSRGSKWQTSRNVLAVFLVSGLWHGANYTFVVWGLFHALLSLPYILLGIRTRRGDTPPAVGLSRLPAMLTTLLLVNLGWVVFRAPDLQSAAGFLRCMFFPTGSPLYGFSGTTAILVGAICIGVEWIQRGRTYALDFRGRKLFASPLMRATAYYAILFALLRLSARGESFIYFQF